MSLLRSAIGRVLRRIRLDQGRTLQDVSRAAGVSMPYLSEIERGRKEVSSEILAGICRALGIALPDLLEEVRAELLRTAVMCVSAVGGSAIGRSTSRPRSYAAGLAACRSEYRRDRPGDHDSGGSRIARSSR
jgi:transcriptional regulator with XRE-family HTH domain